MVALLEKKRARKLLRNAGFLRYSVPSTPEKAIFLLNTSSIEDVTVATERLRLASEFVYKPLD